MAELRLIEHYVSIQGEGPRVGQLTQFVRFAGCNMRCPGWPCDTQHAIEPSIFMQKGFSTKYTPETLVQKIVEVAIKTSANNICLTGGEPFLQPNDKLEKFVRGLHPSLSIECFSNGSFLYPEWAYMHMNFVMDWKLSGSGEGDTAKANRIVNASNLDGGDSIKFVVTDYADLLEAKLTYEQLRADNITCNFYVGAAWGRITNQEIIDFMVENRLPWLLNVQVHKYIWHPDQQGV
jgi:7-carboxy-7-deazaguanine synthase